jgi:hypothetical protein
MGERGILYARVQEKRAPPAIGRERVRKQLIVKGLQRSIVDKECGFRIAAQSERVCSRVAEDFDRGLG